MQNMPDIKLGIVAVSRDCFPVELSRNRRKRVVSACRQRSVPVIEIETVIENEQDVLKADGIAVVDFWAEWCGPCIQMAPILESFAEANADKVKVFKMDVDENPKTAQNYGIRSIPTLIFFKGGEPADISIGFVSESTLQKKLEDLIQG